MARNVFQADAAAGLLLGAVFTHATWRDHFTNDALPPAPIVIQQYVALLLNAVGAEMTSLPPGTHTEPA